MALHPDLKRLISTKRRVGTPPWTVPIEQVRRGFVEMMQSRLAGPFIHVEDVHDMTLATDVGPLHCRLYKPVDREELPIIIYFHGGGLIVGDLESHDTLCRRLANTSEAIVISVDYSKAPEHTHPQAENEAYGALCAIAEAAYDIGGSPGKICLAGDSSGGYLSLWAAMKARDENGPKISRLVLIYPACDFELTYPSMDMDPKECIVSKEELQWYYQTYGLSGSILDADLGGLPPMLVIAAQYDTLVDEVRALVTNVRDEGGKVQLKEYAGMSHGFIQLTGLVEEAHAAIDEIAKFVVGT